MNNVLTITSISAAAVLVCPVLAGPLDRSWIAAEAQWVAHLDAEALRASTIGDFVLTHGDELDIDWRDIEEMRDRLGFDLRTDLMGLTAYGGATDDPEEGVMIAVTNRAIDTALDRLAMHDAKAIDEREIDGYHVFVIHDDDGRHFLHVRDADVATRRVVVLSDDRYELLRAIQVIEAKRPHMAAGESAVFTTAPEAGSIFFLSIAEMDALDDLGPARQIIGLSDTVAIDLGERVGTFFARAHVATASDAHAANISEVLRGLLALGRLGAGEAPGFEPVVPLLNAMQFDAKGHRISVKFDHETKGLLRALEQMDR